ncbi:MAG: S41 family peptidase [Candidatus Acidiferrales bacterium]
MKSVRLFLSVAILFLLGSSAWAKPISIPRHPDYHAGKIVFSYLGDIWMVNEDGSNPRRMTDNLARDIFPRFSPDGKWIAFSSNRYGNYDVFVMPAKGGEPKQLTYHSANDFVVGWSRDSRRVLFQSSRGRMYPGIPSLYDVSVEGGLEQALPTDWGYWASYSPDGKKLAFNRHPMVWWRKHYRGNYAADLWVMDVSTKNSQKLLDADMPDQQKSNNFWPQFGNGEIFFVSDRDTVGKASDPRVMKSVANVWKIPESGGKPVQVTHHTDGSLFYPSISSDGKVLVYEDNAQIWKLDTATGKTNEVKIDIASDDKENNFHVQTINSETDSYTLSPSTLRAAISTHGEIFTIATEHGDVTRVTSSYWRDSIPAWSPDGRWVAYVSDQSGRDEVWVAGTGGENAKKLSNVDTEKFNLTWFPDSKSLLYTASDHKLYRVEPESGATQVLASSSVANLNTPDISPDGKWVSYTAPDRDERPHVHIVAVDGATDRQLPDQDLFSSAGARWTRDGKKLIFLGGYVQGGSAAQRNNVASLYSVSLTAEEKNPMSRDVDDEDAAMASERAGADRAGAERGPRGGQAKPAAEVKIDWDGLARRFHQVTRLSDNIFTAVPSPDGRLYAFVTVGQVEGRPTSMLWTVQENGEQLRRITQSLPREAGEEGGGFGGGISSLQFSKDSRAIYFLEDNSILAVGVGAPGAGAATAMGESGGPSARAGGEGARRKVNFTVRVEVDQRAENLQIFRESYRILKHRFYDAQMNGVDWTKMEEKYEPLLADVGDREELHDVISQMIGELNASHTGISGGGEPDKNAIQTRFPGFDLEPDSGYYKVTYIYKDGPADKDYVKIHVGDYLLAVNGVPLKAGDNYWKNYGLAPGRKFEFTVNSKPSPDGAWKTRVEPASGGAIATLQYNRWVEDRRQMVEKLSGGEIGYLHIRQMNGPALAKFERDLAENHFKKALIIDQRFNPGGGIDEELIEILSQKQYQYVRPRDSVYLTRPQRAFFGPIVVMQNERSTSDAEVFPDGIHTLGLGTTVGTTTYGAVIGTGAYRLIDGGSIRTPGTGLWNISGQNLENFGVPADVNVDNTPADFLAGRDAQLEKAVEVLKENLKKGARQNLPAR